MQTILVVDDDAAFNATLCRYLARFGYATRSAPDGPAMRRELDARGIDLVLLGLDLPGFNPLAPAYDQRLGTQLPLIMMSARGDATERVIGLEMGADDYLMKPFDLRELVARVQAVLRRVAGRPAPAPLDADRVSFDGWTLARIDRRLVSPTGAVVLLSNAEYQLLTFFLHAPRRVVSRERLMREARGRTPLGVERSIDLLISRLRHKLVDDATLIRTVRGKGYLFDARSIQGGLALVA